MPSLHSFYSDPEYREKQSEITKRNWRRGAFESLRKSPEWRKCQNSDCGKIFEVLLPSDHKKYCSHSCSAHVNNQGVVRNSTCHIPKTSKFRVCLYCESKAKRVIGKYCSNKCQATYIRYKFIKKWKNGEESGTNGIATRSLSKHIRSYLFEKYSGRCSVCGWNKCNPTTGRCPLDVDHIDGDSNNNKEENLRLVCPNCHSLSPNYKSLNRGKGRAWRTAKYLKVV